MSKKNNKKTSQENENIEKVELFSLTQEKFLDYSVDVIKDRALPDVRDGLKPVQRRIIFAQSVLGNYAGSQYKKSARVVGDIIGKYHPHGDTSVYEAMVIMAQNFANNMPMVEGHGNFGSLDGDGAAAMRYTEVRMSTHAMHMIDGLKSDVVDFTTNYDDSEVEPTVLPAKIPYLLMNGISGIAIGMSTNILPHNPKEVLDATIYLLENPNARLSTLTKMVKGPDFVYPGKIINEKDVYSLYKNGTLDKSLIFQSHYFVEDDKNIKRIVFDSVPYGVKKSVILTELINGQNVRKVGKKVINPVFTGFVDVRDESPASDIRIVIEVKKDTDIDTLIASIYKNTSLQKSYSSNMLVIADGTPQVLGLKEILGYYIEHQVDVYSREFQFKLTDVERKLEIRQGLIKIVDNIDEVIKIIRGADDKQSAKTKLMKKFKLSELQAKHILTVQLGSLTKHNKLELENEVSELEKEQKRITDILSSESNIKKEIIKYLKDVKKNVSSERNVELVNESIKQGDVKLDKEVYFIQNEKGLIRNYEPKVDVSTLDTDELPMFIKTNTQDTIRLFTNSGVMYNLEVNKVPILNFKSSGYELEDFVKIKANEKVIGAEIEGSGEEYLFITKDGYAKIVDASQFDTVNSKKVKATGLNTDDEVIFVKNMKDVKFPRGTFTVELDDGRKMSIKKDSLSKSGKGSKGKKVGKIKK